MIPVCAADDFRKYPKMQKLRFLKKNHKKNLALATNQVFDVFQVR